MIEQTNEFSLEKHQGPYENWPLKSRLYRDGAATGTKLPGYLIEAQYRMDERFLIVTSYDCPFEEANNFILLSSELKTLSKKFLGLVYSSWLIEKHYPVSDDEIAFDFYGGDKFILKIRGQRQHLLGSLLKLSRLS